MASASGLPSGRAQEVIQHLPPGGIGIQDVRRKPAPGRQCGEQRLGHPGLRRQPRIHGGDAVRVAYHLPPFGVDQSAPRQAREDIGTEIGIAERCEHEQTLCVVQGGKLFAYRQRRFTPGYAERHIAGGNRIAALPARRVDADDSSVGPGSRRAALPAAPVARA